MLHIQFSLVETKTRVRGKIIKQHNGRGNALLEAAEAGKLNVCSVLVTEGTHRVPRTDWIGWNKTSGDYRWRSLAVPGGPWWFVLGQEVGK